MSKPLPLLEPEDWGDYRELEKRGISQTTTEKFGYTVGRFKGNLCQIAHYRGSDGNPRAQHLRFPNKDFLWCGKASKVQLFGQHLWRKGGKRLVVTEGEIDAMTVSQLQDHKWPVVSIPSGTGSADQAFKDNLEFLESFDSVVIAFDNDEPGQKAAKKAALLLTPGRAKIAVLPLNDANDMHQAHRGKELLSCLWEAQPYRPDGIVSGRDMKERVKAPPKPGLRLQFEELQAKTLGIRPGEIWMFTAGSGIGKSTLVQEISYHLAMAHEQTIGCIYLEENIDKTGQRYVGIHMNKPIHMDEGRKGVTDEEIDAAFDETLGTGRFWFYEHFGSSDVDLLLAKIRYMIVGLGCRFIILDHISIVVSGLDEVEESERKTIDKLMTKLRSLVEETQASCLAVVHLKRPNGQGKSWNDGRVPALTDLRGSGGLEQISDVVIAGYRNQTSDDGDENVIGLRVLKNRPASKTGDAGQARYDYDTGRLLPVDDNPFAEDGDVGGGDF